MLAEPELLTTPTPGTVLRTLRNPLLRNGHLLTLSSALTAVIGLAFWSVAAWSYDPATVGRNAAAISMVTLVAAIAQLNLSSAVVRFVPTAGDLTRRFVAGVYLLCGSAALVVGVCSVVLVDLLAPHTNFLDGTWARAMFVAATVAYTIFVIQDGVLTALRRTALVPLENFVFAVLKLGLVVVLAGVMPTHGIFASLTLSLVCTVVVVGAFIFMSAIPRHQRTAGTASMLPPVRQLARFIAFDYLGSILSIGSISLVPIIIVAVLGPEQNAFFSVAWLIGYSVCLININMGTSLVVESATDQTHLARQLRHMLAHTSKLVAVAVIALLVSAPYLLGIFGHAYRDADDTLRLLGLAALPNLLVVAALSSARAQRRMGLVLLIDVASCVLLLPLTWLLLPVMGVTGAGTAWLITQSVLAVGLLIRRDLWLTIGTDPPAARGAFGVPRLRWTVAAFGIRLDSAMRLRLRALSGPRIAAPTTHSVPAIPPLDGTAAKPSVTVVICAYTEDRWDDTIQAVASVQRQTEPPDEIMLVVDYCPGLLERATKNLHGVTVRANHYEKGLSGARNTGISRATCDVVAFLDDDAVAAPNWLAALVAPYADPLVVGVGGRVLPNWLTSRPRWFPTEFDWVVGCSYRGLPTESAPVRNFIGANMSMRRDVLVESGGFDTSLGRIASRPLGCEETELCIRVARAHPAGVHLYEPRAEVVHSVPDSRGTWSYFRSRCYAEGLSKAIVTRLAGADRGLATERTYLSSTIPRATLSYVGQGLRGQPSQFAAALAVVVGVTATAMGYGAGKLHTFRNDAKNLAVVPRVAQLARPVITLALRRGPL